MNPPEGLDRTGAARERATSRTRAVPRAGPGARNEPNPARPLATTIYQNTLLAAANPCGHGAQTVPGEFAKLSAP